MKRILALLLAVFFALPSITVSADEIAPFRINVSRFAMGSEPNVGTYFVLDGQEATLNQNDYSRGLLAEWDDALGAYKCIGSLGYEGVKTDWDIPANGFALMISCFSDSNAFDLANYSATTYFGYSDPSKDNLLVGQALYLYNIDLKAGTVKTAGTEGAEDFTSESYVCVGAPDSTATVEPYNGKGDGSADPAATTTAVTTTATAADSGSTAAPASTAASENQTTTAAAAATTANQNGGTTNIPTTTTASAAPTETGDGTTVAIAIALVAGLAVLVFSAKRKRV